MSDISSELLCTQTSGSSTKSLTPGTKVYASKGLHKKFRGEVKSNPRRGKVLVANPRQEKWILLSDLKVDQSELPKPQAKILGEKPEVIDIDEELPIHREWQSDDYVPHSLLGQEIIISTSEPKPENSLGFKEGSRVRVRVQAKVPKRLVYSLCCTGIVVRVGGLISLKLDQTQNFEAHCILVEPEWLELLPSLTSAPESVQDSLWQQFSSEDSTSLDCANRTPTVNQFSNSDSQESKSQKMSGTCAGIINQLSLPLSEIGEEENSIYSVQVPLANPLACKESGKEDSIPETVSQPSSKSSKFCSQDSSALKTSKDSSTVPTSQEENCSIFNGCLQGFTSASTMSNGLLYPADILPPPFLESGYCWLESPGALSSTGNGRPPGLTKLESQLKNHGILHRGQVLDPAFLSTSFSLPLTYLDPSESRPAAQLLEDSAKQLEIFWTPESQRSLLEEFFTSTPSLKRKRSPNRKPAPGSREPEPFDEEKLEPQDESAIGKSYWCDVLDKVGTIVSICNWRRTPREKIIKAARLKWWWGNDSDIISVPIPLSELEEIQQLYCLIPENEPAPKVKSPRKRSPNKKPASGSLSRCVSVKKGKEYSTFQYNYDIKDPSTKRGWRTVKEGVPKCLSGAIADAVHEGKPIREILALLSKEPRGEINE